MSIRGFTTRRRLGHLGRWSVVLLLGAWMVVVMAVGPAAATTTGDRTAAEPGDCLDADMAPSQDCGTVAQLPQSPPDATSGGIRGAIGEAVFGHLSRWLAEGARWAVGAVFDRINESTTPDLNAPWLTGHIGRIGQISLLWLALVYLAAVMHAAVRARPDIILRAVGVTPLAVAGSAVAVFVLSLLTAGFDESAAWLMDTASDELTAFVQQFGAALMASDIERAAFVGVLASAAVALAAVVVWIELLMREIALYLTASFIPLAVAGAVWPVTTPWLSRLARLAVALAAWKFVIVSSVAMGATMLAHGRQHDGMSAVVAGLGVLLLAAFAPFVVLRIAQVWDVEGATTVQGGLTSAVGRMASPAVAGVGLALAARRFLPSSGADEPESGSSPTAAPTLEQPPPPVGTRQPVAAVPQGRTATVALPPSGRATAALPAGDVDPPSEWVVPPDGPPEPGYPDPPSATRQGGWWVVPVGRPPQPAHPNPPFPHVAAAQGPRRPLPPAPLPVSGALVQRHVDGVASDDG